ncbi:MAG: PAS domain S-box protein, partial [Proteobacteria bacterium]|nr:PAS domain S-box protein [Pseudomonadota bacterium]
MKTTKKLTLLFVCNMLFFVCWFLYVQRSEEQQLKLLLSSSIDSRNTAFDRVLRLEATPFETFVFDYSPDDALIEFLQHTERQSVPGDFEKLLRTFNLSAIWLLRADLSQGFSLCSPALPELAKFPLSKEILQTVFRTRYFHHFFVGTPKGILEIRCAPLQPVSDRDRENQPQGFLCAGRLWDPPYLEMLSGLTESSISIDNIRADTLIPPTSYAFDKGTISFSRVLRSWDDRPLFHMLITSEEPVLREFSTISSMKVSQFAVFCVVLQMMLHSALLLWVNLPLRRLAQSLEKVSPRPLARLAQANNEFGKFARLIVHSFAQQQKLTAEVAERDRAEERLRETNQLLKARDQELNASNMQFIAANQQLEANLQQIRKSEQQLRSQEAYLSLALDIAQETVWEMDMATGMIRIVKMSDTASRDSGYSLDNMHANWSQYMKLADPESRERMQRAIDDHVQGRTERFAYESRLQKKTGEWFWLYSIGRVSERDADGNPLTLLGTSIDITQVKHAQEELNLLATALEQAWECIMITDRHAHILYANPAFERTTGYSIAEVLGKNPSMLKSGKHEPGHYTNMWAALSRGQVWRGHFINRRKDGSLLEEDSTITPLCDGAGTIMNFIAVKRDVTETMRMERQLRQSQKMEAIGTLAGGIAHDFNNILTAINGYTELSLLPGTDQKHLRSNLEQVLRAGARARDLVSQILAFSRQTEQEMRAVSITPIIKEALRFLRASLPATIEIRQHIDAKPDVVMADPTQLHQVLMNLCTNAGYAMKDKGGVLDIGLRRITYDGTGAWGHAALQPGAYLRLSITDTGHGMERDVMEHIFEPYFTTKGRSDGTGLGLAVVHGIVQAHGGDIVVSSEPGKGSKFEVLLPALEVGQGAAETEPKTPARGTESILIVDDEKVLVQMAVHILEPLGYRVRTTHVPEDALALFEDRPHDFDLVITDKIMPRMTGFVFADRIRRIR